MRAFAVSWWRLNGPWVLLVGLYALFAAGYSDAVGTSGKPVGVGWGVISICICVMVLWLGGTILLTLAGYRGDQPINALREKFANWRFFDRTACVITMAALVQVFMPSFAMVKRTIPHVVPFYLDPALAHMDLALFGRPPWQMTEFISQVQPLVLAIDNTYTAWVVITFFMPIIVAGWLERPKVRAQFLLSYFGTWILLGNVLATMMSSVGPCFYGLFYPGPDPFAHKMALLKDVGDTVSLGALDLQATAVASVKSSAGLDWYAISAMPSLHVAIATLVAIVSFKANRWVGVLGAVYLATISVGSVYLGWHYAVDGLFSIAAVCLIWKASGWLVAAKQRQARLVLAPAE